MSNPSDRRAHHGQQQGRAQGQQPGNAPNWQPGGPQYGGPQPGGPQPGGPQYGPAPTYGAPRAPFEDPARYSRPGYPGSAMPPDRRRRADPSSPISPGVSAAAFRSAGIAVGLLAAVLFVSSLLTLLGNLSYQGATEPDSTGYVPLPQFLDAWLFSPFPFYVGAFATFAFLTAIVRRSPLPVVLLRSVLAGAGGTVLLMVVGVFTGFTNAVRQADWTWILTDVVTGPLSMGLRSTAILVGGAAATWLWLGRPGRAPYRGVVQGMPGTVPRADAMPPATVPQQPQPTWGTPDRTGGAQQPVPQQLPAPWPAPAEPQGGPPQPPQWGPPVHPDGPAGR